MACFYTDLGKSVIRMNKPMIGHVVNRLQAALWREAIHLAAEGAVSLSDTERSGRQMLDRPHLIKAQRMLPHAGSDGPWPTPGA